MYSQAVRRAVPVDSLVRKLEQTPMDRIPYHLVHITQIKGCSLEGSVAQDSLEAHDEAVSKDRKEQQAPGEASLLALIEARKKFHETDLIRSFAMPALALLPLASFHEL